MKAQPEQRSFTVEELARLVEGTFEGDGAVRISGVAGIAEAQPGDVSFVDAPKYAEGIERSKASALVVGPNLETTFRPLIRSKSPRLAFVKIMQLMVGQREKPEPGIHPAAEIGRGVRLGRDVSIQAHVTVGDGAVLEDEVVLYPGVYIGEGAWIGAGTLIYANVSIGPGVVIGRNVLIHSGTSVGAQLAGEASDMAINSGHTVLEDDVELGANCTVARGTVEAPTVIGEGTKTDNLIHIAPSVRTGRHCILVAQVSLGRGVVVEDGATIAGQSIVADGVRIGRGAVVAGRSVVQADVPPGIQVSGAPAQPHDDDLRLAAHLRNLPATAARLAALERTLQELERQQNEN